MNNSDFKVLLMNSATFSITMSQIETSLKLLLLIVSIGYTLQRWYYMNKKNDGNRD